MILPPGVYQIAVNNNNNNNNNYYYYYYKQAIETSIRNIRKEITELI
jgi:hypothetical protein